jgi:hypothetical protein
VALALLGSFAAATAVEAQNQTVGLFLHDDRAFDGYTLFAPNASSSTFLIDIHGKQVHSWQSSHRPGLSVYLLENGNLLRTAQFASGGSAHFNGGGAGGRVQEFSWDGDLLWNYDYSTADHRQHHDIERLPNGNVLVLAWELKNSAESIAAGRNPALLSNGELWPDHIVEVQPFGSSGGIIVWEWHAWDHLIQEFDAAKANYGTVADHPELIDLNFTFNSGADWLHSNGIDYSAELDQIVVSVRNFSELWVIDHSTTTAQAAGHTGGTSGRGGDLLYRWGNPQTYDRGVGADQQLFVQHDASWIPVDRPGEGNILVFNNGTGRPGGNHSTVDEIVTPVDEFGDYELDPGAAFGPAAPTWSYEDAPATSFYATNTSGAQRQPNGNTLICEGPAGRFFEVTPQRETVWEYVNPIRSTGPIQQGASAIQNAVFRAYRYGPDYAAFEGRELTPGDPLELYDRPLPVPDGGGSTAPLTAERITETGDHLRLVWDASSCPAAGYHLLFGQLTDLSSYELEGGECGIGTAGAYDWMHGDGGDLFFLIVGVDATGIYESSWGVDGTGAERNGGAPSNLCGVTTKDPVELCR